MALAPSTLLDSLSRLPLLRRSSTKPNFIKSHRSPNPNPNPTPNLHPLPRPSPAWLQSWSHHRPALPRRPQALLNYRHDLSSDEDDAGTSRSTGSSTMSLIVDKLKKFGYIDEPLPPTPSRNLPEKGSVEDIFYTEDGILPDARGGLTLNLNEEVRFPWEKPAEPEAPRKRTRTSLAELTLPEGELRRLRHMAIRMKSKMKIKGAGVTGEIVSAIHEKWRTEEVVRIKCEGAPALNMKRTHEILERKTGGLVIWRSGSSLSLYRGVAYGVSQAEKKAYRSDRAIGDGGNYSSRCAPGGVRDMHTHEGVAAAAPMQRGVESVAEVEYEHEMDELLEGLGPRYMDWPGGDPYPVDADMLPGTVPGYSPPFRILPYGVRSNLGLKEGTALRRLARVLPPHFALGRNRQLQGLAAAMVKLWERSSIAKIALKRGVQLTSSERMAQDIKRLTGATLLSRNKDFLVFYRGKDFLSSEVADALLERERLGKALQDEEEKARLRASSSVISTTEVVEEPGTTGTLEESLEADARWGHRLDNDHKNRMLRAAEVAKHADIVRKLDRRLSHAEYKLMRAAKALAKVEESLRPAESTTDPESLTEEERFMFRKLGLRMKAYLLMGRRGVFDGTIENMHLHWKYRELVKVLVNAKTFAQVKNVALSLEAESGGVLVSVDKVSKGYAVIVYRGHDYKRPPILRPKNLLTKRKALARSIELQRREAISRHVSNLRRRVDQLRIELEQMENVKDKGDEHLYAKLDSAYPSEDEDTEEEVDDAYIEAFGVATDVDSDKDGKAAVHSDSDDYDYDDSDKDGKPDVYSDSDDYDYDDGTSDSFEDEDDVDDDNLIKGVQRSSNSSEESEMAFD